LTTSTSNNTNDQRSKEELLRRIDQSGIKNRVISIGDLVVMRKFELLEEALQHYRETHATYHGDLHDRFLVLEGLENRKEKIRAYLRDAGSGKKETIDKASAKIVAAIYDSEKYETPTNKFVGFRNASCS
jgi:hypothetical protein